LHGSLSGGIHSRRDGSSTGSSVRAFIPART
jgi:hypothetical protein